MTCDLDPNNLKDSSSCIEIQRKGPTSFSSTRPQVRRERGTFYKFHCTRTLFGLLKPSFVLHICRSKTILPRHSRALHPCAFDQEPVKDRACNRRTRLYTAQATNNHCARSHFLSSLVASLKSNNNASRSTVHSGRDWPTGMEDRFSGGQAHV